MDKKTNFFMNIFMSLLMAVVNGVLACIINGTPDLASLLVNVVVGFVVSLGICTLMPVGELGAAVASKLCQPGSRGFTFIMFNVILLIMLLFMCPAMTIICAGVLGGAPVSVVVEEAYSTFKPFYFADMIMLMLLGNGVMALAGKLAHK